MDFWKKEKKLKFKKLTGFGKIEKRFRKQKKKIVFLEDYNNYLFCVKFLLLL